MTKRNTYLTEAERAKREELVRAAHAFLLKAHGGLVMRCADSFECARCGASGAVVKVVPNGAHGGCVVSGDLLNARCAS